MDYTVQQLARLSGVSPRTLRYYHQIGLLSPAYVGNNGYRYYGRVQVDRLQQILFYRELGLPLEKIGAILEDPAFDRAQALEAHLQALTARRARLDQISAPSELPYKKGKVIASCKIKNALKDFGSRFWRKTRPNTDKRPEISTVRRRWKLLFGR